MFFFFANPYLLFLLIPLFGYIFWQRRMKPKETSLQLPHAATLLALASKKEKWATWSKNLFYLGIVSSIIALARPQMPDREAFNKTNGIDIMLVLDISPSMLAKDFEPNRLEVAKKMAIEFVEKRPYDRIGLISFWNEAVTQCPLTTDHSSLINSIKTLEFDVGKDGTAIGLSLATAVNRLKGSQAKSKVVILLTDGKEDTKYQKYISPLAAATLAKEQQIKVYSIGIGSNGMALSPYFNEMGEVAGYQMENVEIDEATLTRIADLSNNGRYFRARDNQELAKTYAEIDQLEKTQLDAKNIPLKVDLAYYFILFAIACFSVFYVLKYFYFNVF